MLGGSKTGCFRLQSLWGIRLVIMICKNQLDINPLLKAQYNHNHFAILDSGATGHCITPQDKTNFKEIDKNVPIGR